MSRGLLGVALALATSASSGFSSPSTAYTQRKEDQRAEQVKALAKKQKVREEIRARRKATKGEAK